SGLALCLLLRRQAVGSEYVRVRVGGAQHSVDCGRDQTVRVEGIRMVDAQVVEYLAEHLQVFCSRALPDARLLGLRAAADDGGERGHQGRARAKQPNLHQLSLSPACASLARRLSASARSECSLEDLARNCR